MDYEHILLQKKGVKVYNIPPMTTSKGHYLDSWKNKITERNITKFLFLYFTSQP